MSDPRIEVAATALLEVFQMRSQYAVASSPLALATVAISAADAADPARRLRLVTSREQLDQLPGLARVIDAAGLVGLVDQGGLMALMEDFTCEWYSFVDLTLPVTVLYEPEAEVGV